MGYSPLWSQIGNGAWKLFTVECGISGIAAKTWTTAKTPNASIGNSSKLGISRSLMVRALASITAHIGQESHPSVMNAPVHVSIPPPFQKMNLFFAVTRAIGICRMPATILCFCHLSELQASGNACSNHWTANGGFITSITTSTCVSLGHSETSEHTTAHPSGTTDFAVGLCKRYEEWCCF